MKGSWGDEAGFLTSVFTGPIKEPGIFRTCPPLCRLHGRLPPTPSPSAATRLAARQINWQGISKRIFDGFPLSLLPPHLSPPCGIGDSAKSTRSSGPFQLRLIRRVSDRKMFHWKISDPH